MKQPRGKEGGTHGEDAAVLSLPALAHGMGPRIANRRIFGFHPPTTLLDRYLPLATKPGHPYLVTHDNYVVLLHSAALFFLAFEVKYTISPAPVKLPMPTIRLTILPKNGDGNRGSRERVMVRAKTRIIRSPNKTSFRIYLGRIVPAVKGAGRAGMIVAKGRS